MRLPVVLTVLMYVLGAAWLSGGNRAEARAGMTGKSGEAQGSSSLYNGEPASRGAHRVLRLLERIQNRLKRTRYQHRTVVRQWRGEFLWDCSGMVEWILKRAAPRTLSGIYRERPVARDFFRVISRAPVERARRGWRRLERLQDARPGDVFAWLRPPDWGKGITGHVGFILRPPRRVRGRPGTFAVRIADATSIPHQNDTRDYGGPGGFGVGTIIFGTDDSGAPTHYGWHGTRAGWTAETCITLGRIVP